MSIGFSNFLTSEKEMKRRKREVGQAQKRAVELDQMIKPRTELNPDRHMIG